TKKAYPLVIVGNRIEHFERIGGCYFFNSRDYVSGHEAISTITDVRQGFKYQGGDAARYAIGVVGCKINRLMTEIVKVGGYGLTKVVDKRFTGKCTET